MKKNKQGKFELITILKLQRTNIIIKITNVYD